MSRLRKMWTRLAGIVAVTLVTVLAPSVAWAAGTPAAALSDELTRSKLRGVGIAGTLCCLLVVVAVALVIYLIVRAVRRRGH